MIRFIHTADIHFGMENYGRIDQATGIHSRLLDFKQSLDTCIDYAIEQDVDLFVFAGDAYKTAHPSPTQQKLLLNSFMKLYKANIPVIITVGNHDNPLSFGKANALDLFAHLPIDGFYVFSKPSTQIIQTKSGPIQVLGIPWPNRHNLAINAIEEHENAQKITDHISQTLAVIIEKLTAQLDPTLPAILVGHLTVTSGIFSGSEKRAVYGNDPMLLPSQLALEPLDYVALGHLHRFQNVNTQGSIPIIYSGSIDRIDFGERKEDKGFCDVTIHSKQKTTYEFIAIKTRPFIQIDITINDDQNMTDQILDAISKHSIDGAILKIHYELASNMHDTVDVKKIQKACSSCMYLVGIIPIRQTTLRNQRDIIKHEMDIQALLFSYFQSQEQCKKRAEILTQKALNLEAIAQEEESCQE